MSAIEPSRLLRSALAVDAAASGMLAMIQILAPYAAARALGIPVEVLVAIGAVLVTYAALLIWLASSAAVAWTAMGLIVVGNAGWSLACIVVAIATPSGLTPLGVAYLLLQAIAVAVLAGAQALGLRRSTTVSSTHSTLAWKEPY